MAVQPGEKKALGRVHCRLPVPKKGYKKAEEGLFTRTRGNGAKMKEG